MHHQAQPQLSPHPLRAHLLRSWSLRSHPREAGAEGSAGLSWGCGGERWVQGRGEDHIYTSMSLSIYFPISVYIYTFPSNQNKIALRRICTEGPAPPLPPPSPSSEAATHQFLVSVSWGHFLCRGNSWPERKRILSPWQALREERECLYRW